MNQQQKRALKAGMTLLATAFPATSPFVLLGTSVISLIGRAGVDGQDFAQLAEQLKREIEEQRKYREASLDRLKKRIEDLDFLDE